MAHREQDDQQNLIMAVSRIRDGLIVLDHHWRFTYVNDQAAKVGGLRKEDMLGKCVWELFPEAIGDEFYRQAHRAMAEQIAIRFDYFYPPLNRWFEQRLYPSTTGLTILETDITERKRLEQDLDARLRQQALLENQQTETALRLQERALAASGHGVLITDAGKPDNPIIYCNPAFEQLTGYTDAEILGRNCRFLQGEDREQPARATMRAAIDQGYGCRVVLRNYCKDGVLFWNELTLSPVRDRKGKLTHFVGILNDISERKHTEAQLQLQQAELAHMSRFSLAGELASGLAHELNQPLSAIVSYTSSCLNLLCSERPSMERIGEAMENVHGQALRASDIIRRLRHFLRKETPRRSLLDMNEMLQEVIQLAEPLARQRRVTLRLELAASLPRVVMDNIQLQQVILNLIRNAIEAMENDLVSTREVTLCTCSSSHEAVEVGVSDTGPGLSSEARRQLFHPFFTTKSDGMGLGLLISKSIIETAGGHLWLTSNPERGVTFHFALPAAKA